MNKVCKIIGIVGLSSVFLGLALILIGAITGGPSAFKITKDKLIELTAEDRVFLEKSELPKFNGINIDMDATKIDIVKGDFCAIEYELFNTGGEHPEYSVDESGILNIVAKNKREDKKKFGIDIGINLAESVLKVYVPDELSDITLYVNAGDINISDIYCSSMNFTINAADIDVKSSNVGDFRFNINASDLDMEKCKVNNITGDVNAGDVDLSLLGNADDYNYDIDTNVGEVSIDDKDYNKEVIIDNKSSKNIKLDSSTSDVEIDFN